ncbi:MAG: FeoB-associated Cys-rich membrane protein [Clostridia bacterium]|nr:FeoB-associated Cys-rich membrane protein [Clostridia bacterium]
MGTGEIVALGILALAIGGAVWYIVRAKKQGVKCIGCPHGKTCSGSCGSCGSCTSCNACEKDAEEPKETPIDEEKEEG